MSFTNQSYRNNYIGTGFVSVYDYTFKIFSGDHLRVLQRDLTGAETELQPGVHYTVQGVGRATGGTITLPAVLTAGYGLAIIRHLPLTQPTDLRNMGGYFPETVEDQLDRLVMIDMQMQDEVNHALKVPLSLDASTIDPQLPAPEAGSAIGWNATENGFVNIPIDLNGDDFVRTDGTSTMTGPLRTAGPNGGVIIGDQIDFNLGNYEFRMQNGALHIHYNGSDRLVLSEVGGFFVGRLFGNNGGVGLGRVTAGTGAPPSDGQEGDVHFQF